jgi:predicted nuclease of predicted toxin-antitoxin system
MADDRPRMHLLIDENVPASVAQYFETRGHRVSYVRDILPARTPDPVIAEIGNRLSAIVVTWDKDFRTLVRRIPEGNKTAFRRLGRVTFRCSEPRGLSQLKRWIGHIELLYKDALEQEDFRMIVEIQDNAFKIM